MTPDPDLCCWQCGKPTPSGVCMGPHPRYNHAVAIARGHVTLPQTEEFNVRLKSA